HSFILILYFSLFYHKGPPFARVQTAEKGQFLLQKAGFSTRFSLLPSDWPERRRWPAPAWYGFLPAPSAPLPRSKAPLRPAHLHRKEWGTSPRQLWVHLPKEPDLCCPGSRQSASDSEGTVP